MSSALPAFVTPLGHGIHAIDTGFHRARFDAAWLIVDNGRAAFVDTGTNHAVPRLLATLDALGLAQGAVDWVIPTHVHLDHAGGAGLLMQSLPQARLLVHPRGARHLVDPSHLWRSATGVYGEEEMARSYGRLVPVAAERVQRSCDGHSVRLGSRPLLLMHTPGHALHHHCVWDGRSRGWFTGDTFGLSYREFDDSDGRAWIMPTTTPVQFDPPALQASIRRLLAAGPAAMYLTHFGRVGDVPRLGRLLLQLLDEITALGRAQLPGPRRHDALHQGLLRICLRSLREHGCTLPDAAIGELLALDLELNAQGIEIWLDRAVSRQRYTAAPRDSAPLRNSPGQPMPQQVHFALDDRVVIITGAAQGIGQACARRLVQDGAAVALWDLADDAGTALTAELSGQGAQALYCHCDVSNGAEVDAALAATLARFGHVDGLVNNAGIFKAAPFLEITESDWDAVIAVNLKGAFLVGQAVAREMVKPGSGRGGAIVNMSSVNGTLTIPTIASYNASKGAINQLTRVMALALAERGVRVNAVAPGTIATELARSAVLTSEEAKARIMSRTPMKRLGEPGEIADVVAYLLSDAASYVTGEIVVADGGRMTLNYTV